MSGCEHRRTGTRHYIVSFNDIITFVKSTFFRPSSGRLARIAIGCYGLRPMAGKNYSDLSRGALVRLLEARDRRDATRFGLVWEANEVERDRALNQDFVALDLDPALSAGAVRGAI
jgi:hypothetical protein